MEKMGTLEKILIYDRILRFTIDLLMGIKTEIKADIEEARLIGETLLEEEEISKLKTFLERVEEDFVKKLDEVLDDIYSDYELFNFDITFLSSIPEEVEREILRLNLVDTLNRKLYDLKESLESACCFLDENPRMKVILTSFKVYNELLSHAIEFNKKFENPLKGALK